MWNNFWKKYCFNIENLEILFFFIDVSSIVADKKCHPFKSKNSDVIIDDSENTKVSNLGLLVIDFNF